MKARRRAIPAVGKVLEALGAPDLPRPFVVQLVRQKLALLRRGKTIPVFQEIVRDLCKQGISILLTDHNVRETLDLVSRAYIIHDGMVLTHGTAHEIINNEEVRRVYLGDQFRI